MDQFDNIWKGVVEKGCRQERTNITSADFPILGAIGSQDLWSKLSNQTERKVQESIYLQDFIIYHPAWKTFSDNSNFRCEW